VQGKCATRKRAPKAAQPPLTPPPAPMSKFAPHKSSSSNPRATAGTICQKCLGTGHFTYQCKNARPYVSRPSRTKQLERPGVLAKLRADGRPSVDVPEEFKNKFVPTTCMQSSIPLTNVQGGRREPHPRAEGEGAGHRHGQGKTVRFLTQLLQ
jgi:hypothetical protein